MVCTYVLSVSIKRFGMDLRSLRDAQSSPDDLRIAVRCSIVSGRFTASYSDAVQGSSRCREREEDALEGRWCMAPGFAP